MTTLLRRFVEECHPELMPVLFPEPVPFPELLRLMGLGVTPRPYRRRRARHGYDTRRRKHARALEAAYDRGREDEHNPPDRY